MDAGARRRTRHTGLVILSHLLKGGDKFPIKAMEELPLHLRSGQTFQPLLPKKAVETGGGLRKLEGDEKTLSFLDIATRSAVYVYSHKAWEAQQTIRDEYAAPSTRRKALGALSPSTSPSQFLRDLKRAQELSLKENQDVQAARTRLRERAALFGLQEAPGIQTEGR